MNPVVHFEMPFEDRERATRFYTSAFGWKPKPYGEEMGNYVVMQTSETDEKGMIKESGRINGGMYQKKEGEMYQHPSFVIAVGDINAAIAKVKEAGGTVNGEPTEIPSIGMYVGFTDTEGNHLSMLQPKGM